MKKIILIAAILLGALTNGQAQVINKNLRNVLEKLLKKATKTLKEPLFKIPNQLVNIQFGTSM